MPLWRYLTPTGVRPRLPVPHFSVVNGGMHAPNSLDFQESMIAPIGAPGLVEAVRAGAEVYAALRRRLVAAGFATGLGRAVSRPTSPPLKTSWPSCGHPKRRCRTAS